MANLPVMIALGNPAEQVDRTVLDAPGGFAWWYVDVITPEGDGLVLIWSYGLPFLPGYADAARRGRAVRPIERPSVNLALYQGRREQLYLLQEHSEVPYAGSELQQIGHCRFQQRVEDGRYHLNATLDCPVPGTRERLRGSLRLTGTARRPIGQGTAEAGEPHVWTPLATPATATVVLQLDRQPETRLEGRAYHDRNTGVVPLHELGIQRWMWGRFPFDGAEWVYYLLWPSDGAAPQCLGFVMHSDGTTSEVHDLAVEVDGERGSLLGLRHPTRLRLLREERLWVEIVHRDAVDIGPFYLRFISEATLRDGQRAVGWGELCEPDRVDLARFRPLVRMRVHRPGASNSMWLPLFNGPHASRIPRLLRHAFARSG